MICISWCICWCIYLPPPPKKKGNQRKTGLRQAKTSAGGEEQKAQKAEKASRRTLKSRNPWRFNSFWNTALLGWKMYLSCPTAQLPSPKNWGGGRPIYCRLNRGGFCLLRRGFAVKKGFCFQVFSEGLAERWPRWGLSTVSMLIAMLVPRPSSSPRCPSSASTWLGAMGRSSEQAGKVRALRRRHLVERCGLGHFFKIERVLGP